MRLVWSVASCHVSQVTQLVRFVPGSKINTNLHCRKKLEAFKEESNKVLASPAKATLLKKYELTNLHDKKQKLNSKILDQFNGFCIYIIYLYLH